MSLDYTISFKGKPTSVALPLETTFQALQELIEQQSQIPIDNQKLFAPKLGMIRPSQNQPDRERLVKDIFPTDQARKRIMLMGTQRDKLKEVRMTEAGRAEELDRYKRRARRAKTLGSARVAQASRLGGSPHIATLDSLSPSHAASSSSSSSALPSSSNNSIYTFLKLVPLPFLPKPEMALEIMTRLRDDLGIQAVMNKYKWTVPVLTELDPSSNSWDGGKLLGLNRNKGQVIELRLRTDAYDGFRNYNEIKKVLLHELTHNEHSGHGADFLKLNSTLEKESVLLDPFGGRNAKSISGSDVYDGPSLSTGDEDEYTDERHYDDGGWFGSVMVLGGEENSEALSDKQKMLRELAKEREQRRRED